MMSHEHTKENKENLCREIAASLLMHDLATSRIFLRKLMGFFDPKNPAAACGNVPRISANRSSRSSVSRSGKLSREKKESGGAVCYCVSVASRDGDVCHGEIGKAPSFPIKRDTSRVFRNEQRWGAVVLLTVPLGCLFSICHDRGNVGGQVKMGHYI